MKQWSLFDRYGRATPQALWIQKVCQGSSQEKAQTQVASVASAVEQTVSGSPTQTKAILQNAKSRKQMIQIGSQNYIFFYPKDCILSDSDGRISGIKIKIKKENSKNQYLHFLVSFSHCHIRESVDYRLPSQESYFTTQTTLKSIQKIDSWNGGKKLYAYSRWDFEWKTITSFNYFAHQFGGIRAHDAIMRNIKSMISLLQQEAKSGI